MISTTCERTASSAAIRTRYAPAATACTWPTVFAARERRRSEK